MKFNLANNQPITVNIDGTDYPLKRFTRGDWVRWASTIDGERSAKATEGLDPIQRSRLLLIYTVEPVGHAELIRRIYSPEGTGQIIRTCADKSGVPADVAAKLLEEGDGRDLETLALLLASIDDPAIPKPATETGASDDPLSRSAGD